MSTIDLKDSPYYGNISRPGTALFIDSSCRDCGSSLAGRREAVRWTEIRGVRFEVEVYRCRCGAGRQIRRRAM